MVMANAGVLTLLRELGGKAHLRAVIMLYSLLEQRVELLWNYVHIVASSNNYARVPNSSRIKHNPDKLSITFI